ncbi:MAG: DUF308 domain-containing protein [Candidatus Dormiibacterota bacterium]
MNWFDSNAYGNWLAGLGRHWLWGFAFGVLCLVAGLLALIRPGFALLALALLFGAQLVVAGVFRLVQAIAVPDESIWLRAALALLAILSFLVGLFLLRHPVLSILILALVLGLFWIIHGFLELLTAFSRGITHGRVWLIASGVLSIIAGVILFSIPGISLLALAIVLGVWLVLFGVTLVARSVSLRTLST